MQQEDSDMTREENVPSWRACDNCRNRKVKCDKRSPCSNCRASNLACRTATRPKEQRQRILISDQYERKVEIIEERLARIESLLENLTSLSTIFQQRPAVSESTPRIAVAAPPLETTQTLFSANITPKAEKIPEVHASSPLQTPRSSITNTDAQKAGSTSSGPGDNAGPFEGASSLSAHSVHATRIIESAMSNDYAVFGRNPEMQDALFALRNLIEKQQQQQHASPPSHEYRFPNQQGDASSVDFSSAKMPRLESVVSFLRLSKEYQNFLDHPFIDFEQFNELCRKVYFATEDYSLGTFALVNGGLFYLFKEIAFVQGKNVPEAAENAALCRANLEYAISHFNIFMAPTNENLQALLLGASYAIDISQPSLCWALTSTAARVCQTLGYHRSVGSPGDTQLDINLKKRMFWFTYILDKSLSLRLGHSSILQDFDITLPLSDLSPADSQMNMWDTLYHHWIKIGYFQGRIYEELYSPRALSGIAADRTQRAKQIATDMRQWYQETRRQLVPSRAYNPLYYEAAASSSEIMYYGLSTLAYRAMPPGPLDSSTIFSNECIETARAALRAHQENTERYKHTNSHIWHGYISWVLINCPFTPFMVLFCHAIATANLSDLQCLGDFVSSLQSSGETVEAAEKLWRLCHVFHRVAELYIQAKMMQQHQQQHPFLHPSHQHQHNHNPLDPTTNSNNNMPSPSTSTSTTTLNVPNMTEGGNNASNGLPFPIDDFEPYLSALGFPNAAGFLNIGQQQQQQQQAGLAPTPAATTSSVPTVAGGGGGGPATEYANLEPGLGATGAGDANSLENWFTGNVNIMSLLEMDLSSIIK